MLGTCETLLRDVQVENASNMREIYMRVFFDGEQEIARRVGVFIQLFFFEILTLEIFSTLSIQLEQIFILSSRNYLHLPAGFTRAQIRLYTPEIYTSTSQEAKSNIYFA